MLEVVWHPTFFQQYLAILGALGKKIDQQLSAIFYNTRCTWKKSSFWKETYLEKNTSYKERTFTGNWKLIFCILYVSWATAVFWWSNNGDQSVGTLLRKKLKYKFKLFRLKLCTNKIASYTMYPISIISEKYHAHDHINHKQKSW